MVRQSQNIFAAAVSAALLNAAAVTIFVLFTVLSGLQGLPLKSVLGAVDAITSSPGSSQPAASSGTGSADVLSHRGGLGSGRSASVDAVAGNGDGGLLGAGGRSSGARDLHQSGAGTLDGQSGHSAASGGASGGGGGTAGGPAGGPSPGLTGDPVGPPPGTPPSVGSAIQQVGGNVAGAAAAVDNGVSNVVGGVSNAISGGAPSSGSTSSSGGGGTIGGATDALLGSGSPTNRVSAVAPAVNAPVKAPQLPQALQLP